MFLVKMKVRGRGNKYHWSKGFSLIELMSVVSIIAILTVFAVPQITRMVPNFELRSLAYDVLANAQKARATAVRENRNVGVIFGTHKGVEYYLVQEDGNNDGKYTAPNFTNLPGITNHKIAIDVHDKDFVDDNNVDEILSVHVLRDFGDAKRIDFSASGDLCGSAVKDNDPISQLEFNSRGLATGDGGVYFENGEGENNTLCYQVIVASNGTTKMKKFIPTKGWIE